MWIFNSLLTAISLSFRIIGLYNYNYHKLLHFVNLVIESSVGNNIEIDLSIWVFLSFDDWSTFRIEYKTIPIEFNSAGAFKSIVFRLL